VHGPAAVVELGRHVLGLVDRRLRGLELLSLLGDDARFGELRLQGFDVRLGQDRSRRATPECAVSGRTRDHGAAEQKGQPALHQADATVSPGTCLAPAASSRAAQNRRGRLRPKEAQRDVIDYEILLLLDAELSDERQNEIVTRTRELVERGGGTFENHEPWGRRRLAYEIDHKPEGTYHLLTFRAEPGTLDEISRVLKITDGVIRHLAVRRPKPGATPSRPPPADDREPQYAGQSAFDSQGEE
jgi:small subunit ribosomal protein S6